MQQLIIVERKKTTLSGYNKHNRFTVRTLGTIRHNILLFDFSKNQYNNI